MKRLLLAVVFIATLGTLALADVPIPKDYRPRNSTPGRCAWCALEALGRYHGYDSMKGLTARNNRVGRRTWYEDELKRHNVKYEIAMYEGSKKTHRWKFDKRTIETWDTAWLEWASKKGYGCAVGLWETGGNKHMLVLTEFNREERTVKIIDSNNPRKETETVTLAWFLSRWDGMVVIIHPRE